MSSSLTEIEDARRIVLERARPLQVETVRLEEALGRALAGGVEATSAVPPFASSAMDGFALRHADVAGAQRGATVALEVVGESRAGRPLERTIERGQAAAISTGAMIPQGADAVIALERVEARNGRVAVSEAVAQGNDIRFAGEDMRAGELVLTAGTSLGPAELGVLASLGREHAPCAKRPRVSVITTGDELVAPGAALARGAIYNSNGVSIGALVRQVGAELAGTASAADEHAATRTAIGAALEGSDVVVVCGGVSVGAHDHVKRALAELGVEESFWGIALKPGKPTWFGTHADTLVFGLPGNPVSAIVTFVLLVAPALRALGGHARVRRDASAVLVHDYSKPRGRAHALRCSVRAGERGWEATAHPKQGSHMLTSMLGADALALIGSERELVRAGERVELELIGEPR